MRLPFEPTGDQPDAIRELSEGVTEGRRWQTLLGVTGSGKTVTMAGVIQETGRPTLVMSHNKTLAAQLYGELRQFFPTNAVEYFISYYDYYQPEAYVPRTDTYIEKDSSINDDIDRLRLRATSALMERRDVIVVASVSAIYGLGDPRGYRQMMLTVDRGARMSRREILSGLVAIQYSRNDLDLRRGTFRVRGDVIEVMPAYEEQAVRIELFGDEVERITKIDPLTGKAIASLDRTAVFPATHYAVDPDRLERAIDGILTELEARLLELRTNGRLLEAQRLESRTRFDIEMLREIGVCPGIENYSRYFDGRSPGERPYCLLDYFPDDHLVIVDESHVSIPQIGAMYKGDRSRKLTLVE
ncbi:MAG: DEAD/DEAH box helicase family protein, partial [marine benthic group bacterium]|nr:DEAD/DEAH box helicase family protein [Gemmatimonadota bacterium]